MVSCIGTNKSAIKILVLGHLVGIGCMPAYPDSLFCEFECAVPPSGYTRNMSCVFTGGFIRQEDGPCVSR